MIVESATKLPRYRYQDVDGVCPMGRALRCHRLICRSLGAAARNYGRWR